MSNINSFENINIGTVPNDRTGDSVRSAFHKVNNNFANIATIGLNVGNITVFSDAIVQGNLIFNNILGNLHITDTTQSTSTTTGALIVDGGIGVSKNIYASQLNSPTAIIGSISANTITGTVQTSSQPNITSLGNLTSLSANGTIQTTGTVSATTLTGTLSTAAQPNITSIGTLSSLSVSGITTLTNTTNSTSFNSGALIVSGGLGIAKDVYIQGNLYVANVVSTTSQTLTVQNSLLYLESNITYPYNYDIGFYGHYVGGSANAYVHTGVIRNDLDGKWYFFSNIPEPASGQVDIANVNVIYDAIVSGAHKVYGSVTGNANITQNLGSTSIWWNNTYTNSLYSPSIYGTLLTAAQPNITSVGTLTSLALSGAITGATSVSATNLTGTLQTAAQPNITSVGNLTSLSASGTIQTTGNVTATNVTGTLQTAAQPNVTSVGNLTSLSVGGTSSHWGAATFYNGITGTLSTAAQTNITSVGTLTSLTVSGSISGATSVTATNITGTLQTATQPNITSVGNLTALAVNGPITTTGNVSARYFIGDGSQLTGIVFTGGSNYSNSNVSSYLPTYSGSIGGTLGTAAQPNITSVGTLSSLVLGGPISGISSLSAVSGTFASLTTSGSITVNSNNNATAIVNGGTNGLGNIGSSTVGFNTVFAKATTAQYADLAEKYLADATYEPGTVIVVGGEYEVTSSVRGQRAIGVVSTQPAYMMNSELDGGTYIALKGRVPCKVTGIIRKGDRLVADDHGFARALDIFTPSDLVFAVALHDNNGGQLSIIEAIIL